MLMFTMTIINSATNLWSFLKLDQHVYKSDLILVLGNSDIRTMDRAVELYKANLGKNIIITGGLGRISSNLFNKPESIVFRNLALKGGVDKSDILVESDSTNTFDNFRFTKKLIEEKNLNVNSIILVTKPYMEKRAYLMAKTLLDVDNLAVTSPNLNYKNYPNEVFSKEFVINMLVGEVQRLILYSSRKEIEQTDIPTEVLKSYKFLLMQGFDKQLILNNSLPTFNDVKY